MSDDEESAEGNKDEEEVGDSPKLDQKNSNSASPPSKHKVSVSREYTQCTCHLDYSFVHNNKFQIFNQRKARSQGDYSKYSPPDWLKQTSLRLSPYLPQVGDIVSLKTMQYTLYSLLLYAAILYCSPSVRMDGDTYTYILFNFSSYKLVWHLLCV